MGRRLSLVRIRFLPEVLAAPVDARIGDDGAVAVDLNLAGQPRFLFAADRGHHDAEAELLPLALGAEVLHAFLDEDMAAAAGAVAPAVETLAQLGTTEHEVDRDTRLDGLVAQDGPCRNLDFLFLVDEI